MVITLDGPAGSGKSTVAKLLAKHFSFHQVDSGAFYRFFTHLALLFQERSKKDIKAIVQSQDFQDYALSQKMDVTYNSKGRQHIFWDGKDTDVFIRTPEIARNIKFIADERYIRELVNRRIQALSNEYSLVADGRDMGTVVFPQADYKFFLTASLEVRAKRRMAEFQKNHPDITFEQVMAEIERRDHEDENREFGRLTPAQNAIFVDTSNLDLNGVVNLIINKIES